MKTAHFQFHLSEKDYPLWDAKELKLHVPTLSAYGIEFAELFPPMNLDLGFEPAVQGTDFNIKGEYIIWKGRALQSISSLTGGLFRLLIHYHGIRDYEALFPFIESETLRLRLSEFYEEAEKVFESGAWLSYAIMCGAVYEGMLVANKEVKGARFADLISNASAKGLLSELEAATMTLARESRNLVHADKNEKPIVSRKNAMDMRTTMDKLIFQFAIKFPS